MIAAGMVLLAIGVADVARQFVGGRALRVVLAAAALAVIVLGLLTAAPAAAILAVATAVAWVWLFPAGGRARAGFWPAVALAVLCLALLAVFGARRDAGILGAVWAVPAPWGLLTLDHAILVAGAVCILLESGNVIVRAALASEMPAIGAIADAAPAAPAPIDASAGSPPPAPAPTLKGGRLIGPLERVVVFALTLTGAYALLAAVLAAKGIVRFPEISRDGDSGDRAEYFLIGSLVSWVVALGAAFAVWWGLAGAV